MSKKEKLTELPEFQPEQMTEKENALMKRHMEKNKDEKTFLPEEIDELGAYVYTKDNVPWEIQKVFMPDMLSVVKKHLKYIEMEGSEDVVPVIEFDYESNMLYQSEKSNINFFIDMEKQQISAHFCIMLFNVESNEKYKQPFSFILNFDDINDFGMEYFARIKEEYNMSIKVEENTIKVTETYKK